MVVSDLLNRVHQFGGTSEWNSPKKVDMDQTYRIVSLGVFSAFESVD